MTASQKAVPLAGSTEGSLPTAADLGARPWTSRTMDLRSDGWGYLVGPRAESLDSSHLRTQGGPNALD